MNKHAFNIGHNTHIEIEYDGPYDSALWDIRQTKMGPQYAAGIIGNGIDMRSAAESAIRRLRTTPYADLHTPIETEIQAWLLTHPMTDVRQGDAHCRLYCILKVLR